MHKPTLRLIWGLGCLLAAPCLWADLSIAIQSLDERVELGFPIRLQLVIANDGAEVVEFDRVELVESGLQTRVSDPKCTYDAVPTHFSRDNKEGDLVRLYPGELLVMNIPSINDSKAAGDSILTQHSGLHSIQAEVQVNGKQLVSNTVYVFVYPAKRSTIQTRLSGLKDCSTSEGECVELSNYFSMVKAPAAEELLRLLLRQRPYLSWVAAALVRQRNPSDTQLLRELVAENPRLDLSFLKNGAKVLEQGAECAGLDDGVVAP